jgi:acid phosphatase type 7
MLTSLARFIASGIGLMLLAAIVLFQSPITNNSALFAHWDLTKRSKEKVLAETTGKWPGTLEGNPKWLKDPASALEFNDGSFCVVQPKLAGDHPDLPKNAITLSAWVRIDEAREYGSFVSYFQDNGNTEAGWILGYNQKAFCFALAAEKKPEPKMTYLSSKTLFTLGKWYLVTGTYDGKMMKIFVNGVEEAISTEQRGSIAYPTTAALMIGRYRDSDEDYPFKGALREVEIRRDVLLHEDLNPQVAKNKELIDLQSSIVSNFVVDPYLQSPTQDSITIMWETETPGKSVLEYGLNINSMMPVAFESTGSMHEIKLTGLKPSTSYVYRANTTFPDGRKISSGLHQFRTTVFEDEAFSFGVIGDTQANPKITGKVANLIRERRPHFVVHVGDVVDVGPDKTQWTDHLFRPCSKLFSVAPVFPTIGNHERNHANYYKYFSLPKPEYYYSYRYGNAEFFVVDSNKSLKPDTEQYQWLDKALGESKAKWKFAYHHHPAWSSDNNDYGQMDQGYSKLGDLNARNLATLYEKHKLDIAFNGHIHLYERTWPLREGKIDRKNGVIYVTSGGGGGSLEDVGALPTWFKAQVLTDFHYCYVNIHGNKLEFKAYDHNSNLFDFLDLEKP